MRLHRSVLVSVVAIAFTSLSCGVPAPPSKPLINLDKAGKPMKFVDPFQPSADMAIRWDNEVRFIVSAVNRAAQPPSPVDPPALATPTHARRESMSAVAVETFSNGIDWACVADAETGSDFSMHGPSYSSAYGVMDEAVRENAPADVAARILAGTASPQEQLTMAESIAARFGFGAWAPSTVSKCSR